MGNAKKKKMTLASCYQTLSPDIHTASLSQSSFLHNNKRHIRSKFPGSDEVEVIVLPMKDEMLTETLQQWNGTFLSHSTYSWRASSTTNHPLGPSVARKVITLSLPPSLHVRDLNKGAPLGSGLDKQQERRYSSTRRSQSPHDQHCQHEKEIAPPPQKKGGGRERDSLLWKGEAAAAAQQQRDPTQNHPQAMGMATKTHDTYRADYIHLPVATTGANPTNQPCQLRCGFSSSSDTKDIRPAYTGTPTLPIRMATPPPQAWCRPPKSSTSDSKQSKKPNPNLLDDCMSLFHAKSRHAAE